RGPRRSTPGPAGRAPRSALARRHRERGRARLAARGARPGRRRPPRAGARPGGGWGPGAEASGGALSIPDTGISQRQMATPAAISIARTRIASSGRRCIGAHIPRTGRPDQAPPARLATLRAVNAVEAAGPRRRIPKQARARERVGRILDAARRELQTRPAAAVTKQGIPEPA